MWNDLKRLAYLVFQLNRRRDWLGGKAHHDSADGWPADVTPTPPTISHHHAEVFWTLSPEVELGGHMIRVGIFSRKPRPSEWFGEHMVRVYVDGKLKHPGGQYAEISLPWSWAARIAKQERWEGGLPGPVDTRDLLIEDARKKLRGVTTRPQLPDDRHHVAAVQEVEEMLDKVTLP